jgi:IclR family transcriptional regulator, acetate operon repressor
MPDKPEKLEKAADGTGALEKALDVLDAVGQAPAGLSQAELAERLALPRTTLYRLLGTLSARGLLRRDPLRRVYCLGQRCFEYARAAYAMPDLVAAAGAELRALRDMTGETVYLAAMDGHDAVALERCDGMHSQRSQSALGQRKPLHCTSQGKAMLAALPVPQREALVREMTLTAVTPHSTTDRRRLLADLRLTATRGFAVDDEEIVPGVRCCGAPIVDAAGQVRGAISVAGPAFRLTTERVQLLGPEVAEAARRIGAQLPPARAESAPHEVVPVHGEWAFDGGWPLWNEASKCLWWADQLAPAVHRAAAAGDELVARLGTPIRALLPHAEGVAVLTSEPWQLLDAGGQLQPLPSWPQRPCTAACVAPDGTPWVCTADGERWRAPLHRQRR